MHIYAFGSVCRGEIDHSSDVDLLALVDGYNSSFDPNSYSIYSYKRLRELWDAGSPFAWHLATESKLLYASDSDDFIMALETPRTYTKVAEDCEKFENLFSRALSSLVSGASSPVFELSTMFLSIRNFATCYALGHLDVCEFSRYSALRLGAKSLRISDLSFKILERSRILSTRGYGPIVRREEARMVGQESPDVRKWMLQLRGELRQNG